MKVGVRGRVIVGPAGGPGQVDVPVRFAVVREGVDPKTIVTKFQRIGVTIASGEPHTAFSIVEDDLTFAFPRGAEIDFDVVYVGFDPVSAQEMDKARRKPRQARPAVTQHGPGARPIGRFARSPKLQRARLEAAQRDQVVLSARMSAITARAPALVNCAPRFGLVWLPPMKPIGTMLAAWAAATPAGESSTTMQSDGATCILAAT